jgi:ATP-dependent DNA ligase
MKHDGYRLMVRRDGQRVSCFTRNGHDWADRFPAIVDAALRTKATSFLIDGEVVITSDDGMSDFRALRSKRRGHEAVLFAFDLIEHDGDDLRNLPLTERKWRLVKLIGKAQRRAKQAMARPCLSMSAAWTLRASYQSGRTRPIAADRRRRGSNRRTRPARRCAESARRSGAKPLAFKVHRRKTRRSNGIETG